MQTEEFINAVFEKNKDLASELLDFLENVPGRNPHKKYLDMSAFYKNLDPCTKENIKMIVDDAIHTTLFSFFCILDHVSFLENTEEKSAFELYAIKDGVRTLINDPNKEELHNLYNDYVLPQD